jgi:hypothetical protein
MLLIPISDAATKSTIIDTEVLLNMALRLSCSIKRYNDWKWPSKRLQLTWLNQSASLIRLKLTSLIKDNLDIPFMVVYTCKKCGELNYLTPHAFWNIADFGAKCEKCETINTITLEKGELKKQVWS